MRNLFFVLIALLLVVPQHAQARRRGGGMKSQEMHFVAATQIPGKNGTQFSLCHLTTKFHIFGIGLWRSSDGYVLSDKTCEGDTYFKFSDGQFAEAKQLGLIEETVPDEPAMTKAMLMSGFFGWAILVPVILFGAYRRFG